ncbi:MAG: monovalent cation:proton antiporter-2 (CPA2) family protein [Hyphomicrobiales bacterium]
MAIDATSTLNATSQVAAHSLAFQAIILLGAAVIFAPIFKRLGLGTVLGYLAAGVVIGALPLRMSDGVELLHFAELGIVFLLFIIGLELKPSRLWALRHGIFGAGLMQVTLSAFILGGLCFALNYSWKTSLLVGLGLALSSTAFAMQILDEKGEFNTKYGQKSFSIVLFQDIAIVPILAIIPFLVPEFLKDVVDAPSAAALDGKAALQIVGVIAALFLIGRYCLNPLFRIIANTGAREMMIVVALFVVLGAGFATQAVGLSMAMGAFFAGVMLADSAYRHELEANIEPFRGILLGLFFMAVGLSLNLDVVFNSWATILLAAPAIMIVKGLVIYSSARIVGSPHNDAIRVAALLPQVGEFAFVIFSVAVAAHVVSIELASIITAIVTVTMALTPLFVAIGNRLIIKSKEETMEEDFAGADGSVLVIGFGRFGQIVCQTLLAQGLPVTIIDHNAERIRSAARFGFRIYYGEGRRLDVLRAAGIQKARIVAVCSDTSSRTEEIVSLVRKHFPETKIYARAYDRAHTLELMELEVDFQIREMFESALVMGRGILDGMDVPLDRADFVIEDVRRRDMARLQLQQAKGLFAAADIAFQKTLVPEPLTEPQTEAKVLSEETAKITEISD